MIHVSNQVKLKHAFEDTLTGQRLEISDIRARYVKLSNQPSIKAPICRQIYSFDVCISMFINNAY